MKIEKIAEKITDFQVKKPSLFLMIFGIITLMLIPGIFNLVSNVEPSLEKVLPQDIEEVKAMNDMRSQFGADMMYLIVYSAPPIFDSRDPAIVKYINVLSEKIKSRENVLEVNAISDIVKDGNDGIIPDSLQETKQIISQNMMSNQYLNDDYSFSVIRIRTDTGASASVIKEVVESINGDIESVEAINPGSRIELTGFNAIDKATFEVIMNDFAFITVVSMIFVLSVVFITFKSAAKGFLPMVVVMVALLWTMGIVGYLGLTITVVSMVAAAMIMGLGIDFGIHLVHSFSENRKRSSRNDALKETLRELLRAMVGASLTTISGFLALLFGLLPAMKNLGIILAIGIFTTLIGAVLLLPVLLFYYDKRNSKTVSY